MLVPVRPLNPDQILIKLPPTLKSSVKSIEDILDTIRQQTPNSDGFTTVTKAQLKSLLATPSTSSSASPPSEAAPFFEIREDLNPDGSVQASKISPLNEAATPSMAELMSKLGIDMGEIGDLTGLDGGSEPGVDSATSGQSGANKSVEERRSKLDELIAAEEAASSSAPDAPPKPPPTSAFQIAMAEIEEQKRMNAQLKLEQQTRIRGTSTVTRPNSASYSGPKLMVRQASRSTAGEGLESPETGGGESGEITVNHEEEGCVKPKSGFSKGFLKRNKEGRTLKKEDSKGNITEKTPGAVNHVPPPTTARKAMFKEIAKPAEEPTATKAPALDAMFGKVAKKQGRVRFNSSDNIEKAIPAANRGVRLPPKAPVVAEAPAEAAISVAPPSAAAPPAASASNPASFQVQEGGVASGVEAPKKLSKFAQERMQKKLEEGRLQSRK